MSTNNLQILAADNKHNVRQSSIILRNVLETSREQTETYWKH